MSFPTLTQIEDANWDYLKTNATAWTTLANTWETAFTEIRDASASPGGTPWTGAGAQSFQHRAAADVVQVHSPADMLRAAAAIASRGAEAQIANKGLVLSAVDAAERDDFRVSDDYSVTDTYTYYSSAAEQQARELAAQGHASFIKSRAANLVTNDAEIARNLTTTTAGLHEFAFGGQGEDGGAGGNNEQPQSQLRNSTDPADVARQRDEATVNDPDADPVAQRLAQERLDDLRNSQIVGPLPIDPVLGGDARTRAQARRQFQDFLESGQAYPDRPPLTPDQATQMLDKFESQAREIALGGFADQLQAAGVSPPGIQRALDEVQSGKSPRQVIHEAGVGLASWGGALGGGAESHGAALPQGRHWGGAPVWSKADAKALEVFGRKLGYAGIGLDALLTFDDIAHGAPRGEEIAKLGGRTLGGIAGGFAAGAAWGSLVGPEGTLIVGLLGAVAGGLGGENLVKLGIGG